MANENSRFALIVTIAIVFIFIWNFLLLPTLLENLQASRAVEAQCDSFCSGELKAATYELIKDKEVTHCHCRNEDGVMIGKTAYSR
jgi:hypothetical protein